MSEVRATRILRTIDEIAQEMRVGRRTVKRWKKKGAPIYVVERKYQAEHYELWQWVAQNTGKNKEIAA